MKSANSARVVAALAVALLLPACSTVSDFWGGGGSDLEQLRDAQPRGTAFQQAQFKDYSYLARSFGDEPSGAMQTLANAYAAKALIAAGGADVAPEDARSDDQKAMRTRLSRALGDGHDRVPAEAARAQADYDCWVLNDMVAAQEASARQCRASLDDSLAQLETDVGISAY